MNQNGGIHKGGFAVLCHRNGGSESPGILTEDNITSVAVIYVLLSWGVLASDWVFKYSAAEPPVRCGKVRTGGSKSPGIITLQTTAPISF